MLRDDETGDGVKSLWRDRNIAPRDYRLLRENDMVRVSNIFYTIQGEGPFAGHSALFIRLSGCNLGSKSRSCQWCDADFRFDRGVDVFVKNFPEIIERTLVENKAPNSKLNKPLVVVTGGEPMMQDAVSNLIRGLMNHYVIQVESNGTRLAENFPEQSPHVQLVVSPKVVNGKYHKPPEQVLDRADCLKFLVEDDTESPYHDLPDFARDFLNLGKPVFVSPIAIYKSVPWNEKENRPYSIIEGDVSSEIWDLKTSWKNHRRAARLVMENTGVRLSLQQQIYLGME